MPRSPSTAPPPPRPVKRSEFARLAGYSRSRISELCGKGGPLAAACLLDGSIDVRHPSVEAWARARGIDTAALAPGSTGTPPKHPKPQRPPEPATDRAGATDAPTRDEFDALTLRKKLADVIRVETRNARDAGRLISRALVEGHVYGYLDRLHRQLLGPVAQTLSVRLRAAVSSGATDEELQATIRQLFSSELQEAKRGARAGIAVATRVARSNEDLPDCKHDSRPTD